jgi:peroxiredoxin
MQTIFDQKPKGGAWIVAVLVLVITGFGLYSFMKVEGTDNNKTEAANVVNVVTNPVSVMVDAPEFSAEDVKLGKEISLARFAKMDVILFFWNPTDTKQSARIERLIEIQKAMMGKVAIIGVARTDDADAVISFIKEYKINFPVILSTSELETGYMADPDNSYCVLIGLDRTLLKTYTGVIDINAVTASIEKDMK